MKLAILSRRGPALAAPLFVCAFGVLLASCKPGAAPQETGATAPPPPPVERPALDESSRWEREGMPGGLALEPSLEGFQALRIAAFAVRGALVLLSFEDGELAAYPSSAIAARSGEAGAASQTTPAAPLPELPPPIWRVKLGFAADSLLALPDALIAALDAGAGRLVLLSGADGSILAEVPVGKGSRFAPAWTAGYLAYATDSGLDIVRTAAPASPSRVPLPSRPAGSVYSALGRFAILLEDGSLVVIDAASSSILARSDGLDPRGGLACDGAAWYALDSTGQPRAFAFSDGARASLPSQEAGPYRFIHSVSAAGLRVGAGGTTRLLPLEASPPAEFDSGKALVAAETATQAAPRFGELFAPSPAVAASIESALDKYLHRETGSGEDYLSFAPWASGSVAGGWGEARGADASPAFIAYRYLAQSAGERRLSYEASDEREVLLAVFSAEGGELASNVGEMVDRDALRLPFEAGRIYWIVAGGLERTRRPGAASVRLD